MNCSDFVRARKGGHHPEQSRTTYDNSGLFPFLCLTDNILSLARFFKHRMTLFCSRNGRQSEGAAWHYVVILRERSEPKDLLGCAAFRGRCPLDEIPPLRSECHYSVILRERSEPKDLLGCATFRGWCPLEEIPPLRSG